MNAFATAEHSTVKTDPPAFSVSRLIVGLILILPALVLYFNVQLQPALRTLAASQTDSNFISEPEFIGMENFNRLFSDPRFPQALGYTAMIVAVRLLIVAIVPPLVGALVGAQHFAGRATNRLLLSFLTILIAPVPLAILLRIFISPFWGATPSPLTQPVMGMALNSPEGARTTLIAIDSIITVAIAAVIGGAAFMAVMRGRDTSSSSSRAGIGVWLVGCLLTLASAPQTFTLPYILTAGGPGNSTNTIGLNLFNTGFRNMQIGYASAQAVLMIATAVFIGLLVGVLIWGFRLRLTFTPPSSAVEASSLLSFLSTPLILLIGLPSVGLVAWGLWLASTSNGFSAAGEMVDTGKAFANTVTAPWTVIWLVQIPVTYLLGMALGFIRPINRFISNFIFLGFVVLAFIPQEAISFDWYNTLRELGWINTTQATGYASQVGLFSLIVFKLFFDGTAERYQAAIQEGQTSTDAFLNRVFLPSIAIVLLVGMVLSFFSAHAPLWPLITVASPENYGFTTEVAAAANLFPSQSQGLIGLCLTVIGLFGLIFLPIFALLQVLVVDRLAILAGPEVIFGKGKSAITPETPTYSSF